MAPPEMPLAKRAWRAERALSSWVRWLGRRQRTWRIKAYKRTVSLLKKKRNFCCNRGFDVSNMRTYSNTFYQSDWLNIICLTIRWAPTPCLTPVHLIGLLCHSSPSNMGMAGLTNGPALAVTILPSSGLADAGNKECLVKGIRMATSPSMEALKSTVLRICQVSCRWLTVPILLIG